MPIDDLSLGYRFWQTQNTVELAKILADDVLENPLINSADLTDRSKIRNDSGMVSYVNSPNADFVRESLNRADLFAATHTLSEDERTLENMRASENARALAVEVEALVKLIAAKHPDYSALEGDKAESAQKMLTKAMNKLLAADEVSRRASRNIPLSDDGKLALCNATLGLASMIRDGKLSEDAVIFLANNEFYDGTSCADMIRFASRSIEKIKDSILKTKELDETIKTAGEIYRSLAREVPREKKDRLLHELVQLERERIVLGAYIEKIVNTLNVKGLLTDANGEEKSDAKFQKKQLDMLRCHLRAFRFDIDSANGKLENSGRMERFRRKVDNHWRDLDDQVIRMTKDDFDQAKRASYDYNARLEKFINCTKEAYASIGQNVPEDCALESLQSYDFKREMEKSTDISHETNKKIRYYFAVEKDEAKKLQQLHEEVDSMLAQGGTRSATVEIGADVALKLGLPGVGGDVKVGGKILYEVSFSKAEGTAGQIVVTYRRGGAGFVSAKAKMGVDPESNSTGFGAQVKAEAEGGAVNVVSKTYPSLEDFALDTGGSILAFKAGIGGLVIAGLKGIGHGIVALGKKLATKLGLRIDKSLMDNRVCNQAMRANGRFSALSGFWLRRRNPILKGEREADEIFARGSIKANAGMYLENPYRQRTTALSEANASVHGGVSREVNVHGKTYQLLAERLSDLKQNTLQRIYNQKLDELDGRFEDGPEGLTEDELRLNDPVLRALKNRLRDEVVKIDPATRNTSDKLAAAMNDLLELFTELENAAVGKSEKDNTFWGEFSRLTQTCICANALLEKEAEALGDHRLMKVSKDFVARRLGNPTVKVPTHLFTHYMMYIRNFTIPPRSVKQFGFSVGGSVEDAVNSLNPLGVAATEDVNHGMKSAGIITGKSLGSTVGESVTSSNLFGMSRKVEVNVIREKPKLSKPDMRPWINDKSTTVDVNVTASFSLYMIADVVARGYVESLGELDSEKQGSVKEKITDDLLTMFACMVPGAMTAVPGLLAMPIVKFDAESYYNVMNFLGVIPSVFDPEAPKGMVDAGMESQSDGFKTLRCRFEGGRLASVSVANTRNISFTLGPTVMFGAGASVGGGLHFGYKTSRVDVDYSFLPRPSLNSMLGRVADLMGTGDSEMLKHFLTRNKFGALRLLHAAFGEKLPQGTTVFMNRPISEQEIEWFNQDVDELRDRFKGLRKELNALVEAHAGIHSEFAEKILTQLDEVGAKINTMREKLADPAERESVLESDQIELCGSLLTTMTKGFEYLQEVVSLSSKKGR